MSNKKRTTPKPKRQPRQYVVTVPNPEYQGKTFGVQFWKGRALIAPHTLDPIIGLGTEEIAIRMRNEFGYDVQPVEGV